MELLPNTFLALPNDKEKAKYVVLPIPYDSTASFKPGAREAPRRIIWASKEVEFYSSISDFNTPSGFVYTLDELTVYRDSVDMIPHIRESVSELLKEFPKRKYVFLGGEHSITSPITEVLKPKNVIIFDAHGDMRELYEGTKYSHACNTRRISEQNTENILVYGVRAVCFEENEFYESQNKIKLFKPNEKEEFLHALNKLSGPTYLSVDMDAFDISIMPAVGTPEPGGILWQDYMDFLSVVKSRGKSMDILGFDVAELMPIPTFHSPEFMAARLVLETIAAIEKPKDK